MHLGRQFC